jgi:hypothetical protein
MLEFSAAAACGGLVVVAATSVAATAEAQGILQKLNGGAAPVTFSMDSPRRGNKAAVVIEVTARQSAAEFEALPRRFGLSAMTAQSFGKRDANSNWLGASSD